MRSVKSTLIIEYSQLPEIFSFREKIIHSLTKKKPTEKLPVSDGIKVVAKNQKAHFIVDSRGVFITIEALTDQEIPNFFLSSLDKIKNVLKIDRADHMLYRRLYISESQKDFEGLLEVFKNKLLRRNEIINDASDVGLPLDFKINGYSAHTKCGPMKKSQLISQFLKFEHDDIPDFFLFGLVHVSISNLKLNSDNLVGLMNKHNHFAKKVLSAWRTILLN